MKQASWLVFTPPGAQGEAALEKLRLVRDGFSIWPLLFGPLWFLVKRLWLGALVALVLVGAALTARIYLGIADPWGILVTFLPALLLALEAPNFERRKLLHGGWQEAGVVRAGNATDAEAKAMARLVEESRLISQGPSGAPLATRPYPSFAATGPVLGLFPEAAGQR